MSIYQKQTILTIDEPAPAPAPILNLTQHAATPEQVAAGVVEPTLVPLEQVVAGEAKKQVQALLTFDTLPHLDDIERKAKTLAAIARWHGCTRAMIGGAPFFMAALERALIHAGIQPIYAFSVRDSIEQPDGNGGVKKVNIFRHAGFVEVVK